MEWKGNSPEREKIFANHISDKRLIPVIYKERLQLKKKRLKIGKGLE